MKQKDDQSSFSISTEVQPSASEEDGLDGGFFEELIIQRANEAIQLLKFPMIASGIFSRLSETSFDTGLGHVDENSSLFFLLQSPNDFSKGEPLHPFTFY